MLSRLFVFFFGFLRKLLSCAVIFLLISFVYGNAIISKSDQERNINILTACGPTGTRGDTCPRDRGTCSIDPLANNIWSTNASCVCKPGYYGENCQDGPLCNNTNDCSGRGECAIQKLANGTFVQKCFCNNGYFGNDCSIQPCAVNPCLNGGTCVAVSIPDGSYSLYCRCLYSHFGNICQFVTSVFGTENRIRLCPLDFGYNLYGKSCYKIIWQGLGRDVAKQFCESAGAHLAVINNQNEFNEIIKLPNSSYWVKIKTSFIFIFIFLFSFLIYLKIGANVVNKNGNWFDGTSLSSTSPWLLSYKYNSLTEQLSL